MDEFNDDDLLAGGQFVDDIPQSSGGIASVRAPAPIPEEAGGIAEADALLSGGYFVRDYEKLDPEVSGERQRRLKIQNLTSFQERAKSADQLTPREYMRLVSDLQKDQSLDGDDRMKLQRIARLRFTRRDSEVLSLDVVDKHREVPGLMGSIAKSIPRGALETLALTPQAMGEATQGRHRKMMGMLDRIIERGSTPYYMDLYDLQDTVDLEELNEKGTTEQIQAKAREIRDRYAALDLPSEPADDPISQTALGLRGIAEESFNIPPEHARNPVVEVGQGIGSSAAFLASRLAPGGQTLLPLVAAGSGAGEAVERAVRMGATDDQRAQALLAGTIPGLYDMLPVERLLSKFKAAKLGGKAKGAILGALNAMWQQGMVEGGQEMAQELTQNYIARVLGYSDEELTKNVAHAGAIGFAVGAVMGGAAYPFQGERSAEQRADEQAGRPGIAGLSPPPGGSGGPGGPAGGESGPSAAPGGPSGPNVFEGEYEVVGEPAGLLEAEQRLSERPTDDQYVYEGGLDASLETDEEAAARVAGEDEETIEDAAARMARSFEGIEPDPIVVEPELPDPVVAEPEVMTEESEAFAEADRRRVRSEKARERQIKAKEVTPGDDLLTAVAKLGGLNRDTMEAEGVDPAEFDRRAGGIYRVFTKQGVPADEMMQRLQDHGFDFSQFDGVGYNQLVQAIALALGGRDVRSDAGAEVTADQAIQAYEDEGRQLAELAEDVTDDPFANPADDFAPGDMLDENEYSEEMDAFGRRVYELARQADAIEDGAGEGILERAAKNDQSNDAVIDELEEWIRERTTDQGAEPAEAGQGDRQEVQATKTEGGDLFGQDTSKAQALADEQRRRDEARSGTQDVAATGFGDLLDPDAQKQMDITDVQPRAVATPEDDEPKGKKVPRPSEYDEEAVEVDSFTLKPRSGKGSKGAKKDLLTRAKNQAIGNRWPWEMTAREFVERRDLKGVRASELSDEEVSAFLDSKQDGIMHPADKRHFEHLREQAESERKYLDQWFDDTVEIVNDILNSTSTRNLPTQARFIIGALDEGIYVSQEVIDSYPGIENFTKEGKKKAKQTEDSPGRKILVDDLARAEAFEDSLGLTDDEKKNQSRRARERLEAYDKLAKPDDELIGLELEDKDGRFVAVFEDASQPGKFRISHYDSRGFSSHDVFDSPSEALADAIRQGYTKAAPGSLDRLAATEEWTKGMEAAAEVQRLNQESWRRSQERGKRESEFPRSELEAFFVAFRQATPERLERARIKPEGMSGTDWLMSVRGQKPTWHRDGRKTGNTGIQMLSTKNLWPTEDNVGEDLRKSMLAAIRAINKAPGYTVDWIRNIEDGNSDIFADRPSKVEAASAEAATSPENDLPESSVFSWLKEFQYFEADGNSVTGRSPFIAGDRVRNELGQSGEVLHPLGPGPEWSERDTVAVKWDSGIEGLEVMSALEEIFQEKTDGNESSDILEGSTGQPETETKGKGESKARVKKEGKEKGEEDVLKPKRKRRSKPRPADWGTKNTVFTQESADDALAKLKSKLNQLNSGFDPELAALLLQRAGYHIEAGARRFVEYAGIMLDELGEAIRPYLAYGYRTVRDYPGFDASEMDSDEAIEGQVANLDALLEIDDAASTSDDLAGDTPTGEPTDQDGVGTESVSGEPRTGDGGTGATGSTAQDQRDGREDGGGVPEPGAVVAGEPSDNSLFGPDASLGSTTGAAVDTDGRGSDSDGRGGVRIESTPGETAQNAADQRAKQRDLSQRRGAQRDAESVAVTAWGDEANISATLPMLLPLQQEDVLKAERRFFSGENTGQGILFTNGTGTGKTYTGLGIAKRFAKQGLDNILIVVPNTQKIEDWIADGKNLKLRIQALPSTRENGGAGPVITTFANMYQNRSLMMRDWDLLIVDESHKLKESSKGAVTAHEAMFKTLTRHPHHVEKLIHWRDPAWREVWHRMDAWIWQKVDEWQAAEEAMMTPDQLKETPITPGARVAKWFEFLDDGQQRFYENFRPHNERLQPDVDAASAAPWEENPRAVMLSATPFSYHFSVSYADQLLFDITGAKREAQGERLETSGRYNAPDSRESFFVTNFGYRMRYNKLTTPEAAVDVGLLEREFTERLRREGALSGRMLDIPHDYSREFVRVHSDLGTKIDKGMSIVMGFDEEAKEAGHVYPYLRDALSKKWNYLYVDQLFETAKARQIRERINQHIALGRKVVVFHRYNRATPSHPFDFSDIKPKRADNPAEQASAAEALRGDITRFHTAFPEYRKLNLSELQPVPLTLESQFGEEAVGVINGTRGKKERRNALLEFNRPDSSVKILVIQVAAGKEGISAHDVGGNVPRVMIQLGLPVEPTTAIQTEGRIYRLGSQSDAVFEYPVLHTNMEHYNFGTKISQRVRTAENLAMGDQARALEESFVEGYVAASDNAPSTSQGKGGKDQDRVFDEPDPFTRAKTYYLQNRKRTARDKSAEGIDYFPTPEPLGFKMVEWASMVPGESALEPSAGHGAIARFFSHSTSNTFIEQSPDLGAMLALRSGEGTVLIDRFENHKQNNKYHGIVMNPPFGTGTGGKTAIEHLGIAARHLHLGGRIVALVPEGGRMDQRLDKFLYPEVPENMQSVSSRLDRLREYPGADLQLIAQISMPTVTFERAGTKVKTQILVMDYLPRQPAGTKLKAAVERAARPTQNRDLSDIETTNDLFDRIEHMAVPERSEELRQLIAAGHEDRAQKQSSRAARPDPEVLAQATTMEDALLKVTETTTKGGTQVWEVTGAGTRTHKDMLKSLGGRWYRPKRAWSFYEEDPTASIEEKLAAGPSSSAPPLRAAAIESGFSGKRGTPMTKAQVEAQISPYLDTIDQRMVTVTVLESFEQMPSHILERYGENLPDPNTTEGLYYENEVYLIASNLYSPDHVDLTLAHELVGHVAVLDMIGPEGHADLMARIRFLKESGSERMDNYVNHVRELYPELYDADGALLDEQAEFVEAAEVIAKMAEDRTTESMLGTLWRRLREMVRAFLKRLGIVRSFTDADVDIMISKAEQRLRARPRRAQATKKPIAVPPLAARRRGTRHQNYGPPPGQHPQTVYGLLANGRVGGTAFPNSRGPRSQWTVVITHNANGELFPRGPRRFNVENRRLAELALERAGLTVSRRPAESEQAAQTPLFDASFTVANRELEYILSARWSERFQNIPLTVKASWYVTRLNFQDKYLTLKNQQAVIAQSRSEARLSDDMDAYLAETLYHSRASSRVEELNREHIEPLMRHLAESDISIRQLETYLHARHAPEANAEYQRRNPDREDNEDLSGMSNDDAAQIMSEVQGGPKARQYNEAARRVDAMNEMRLDLLESYGLVNARNIRSWRDQYDFYVPLHRDMNDDLEADLETAHGLPKRGRGFSIGGKETKARTGSHRVVINVLAHTVANVEATIIRGEKNRVGQALLRLVQANPNPELWDIDKREFVAEIDRTTGFVITKDDPQYDLKPHVMDVKVDGKVHRIVFNPNNATAMRMAVPLKNLGTDQTGTFINALHAVNRFLAMVNTSFSPEFIVSNFTRDLQTAGINLSVMEEAEGVRGKILKDTPAAIAGIRHALRKGGTDNTWAARFREFERQGAVTGWLELYESIERRSADLQTELRKHTQPRDPRVLFRKMLQLVSDYNHAVENGVRLSAYWHLTQQGISPARAAQASKELTVNFNRKGLLGKHSNALYLFFNASVQGITRNIQMMRSPGGMRVVGAITAFGFLMDVFARLFSNVDPEDGEKYYDKLKSHVKERNFVIPVLGSEKGFITLPMPYGYNIPYLLGGKIAEALPIIGDPNKNLISSAGELVVATWSAFSPIGSEATVAQTLSPTIFDPAMQWKENKDWAGRPVYRQQNPFDVDKPAHTMHFNSTSKPARWITKALAEMTGGNEVRSGAVDINPAALDLIIGTIGGSAGKFGLSLVNLPWKILTEGFESVESYDVPFVRRLATAPRHSYDSQRFYDNLDEIKVTMDERELFEDKLAAARQRGASDAARVALRSLNDAMRQHRWVTDELADDAKEFRSEISDHRKELKEIDANDDLSIRDRNAQVKVILEEINRLQREFNGLVRESKKLAKGEAA